VANGWHGRNQDFHGYGLPRSDSGFVWQPAVSSQADRRKPATTRASTHCGAAKAIVVDRARADGVILGMEGFI